MNARISLCPNVIIADDHPITRFGVKYILKEHFPVVRAREAENEEQIIHLLRQSPADILLLDLNMPDTDPQRTVKTLLVLQPSLNILILTVNKEELFGPMFLKLGARGYINKLLGEQEIIRAVETVLRGELYIREEMRGLYYDKRRQTSPYEVLTNREKGVLCFLARGESLTQIGKTMQVGLATVFTHKANIFRKLKINNLLELKELVDEYPL